MRFAASRSKPAPIYARGNIRWRQSSSHSNAICNQRFQNHIELRTQTQPLVAKHIEGTNSRMKRWQPQPPHTWGTFHRRLQPLYTEKHKVSCSGFLPNSPLAFVTASLPHHFPSSPLPIITTSLRHHFPSSPLPIVTTSHRHHLPSPTSLPHHFPSSPPPFLTTPLHHHFPSSPLPSLTTSHRHHFPSSPPPFVTTLCHSFLILCDVPPFIKVNSIDSYSFVMYCFVMYCDVMYHPSSRSIPPLLIVLLCIVMLCIVRSRTTLHQSQFHQVKVIRNSEVLLPNFLW